MSNNRKRTSPGIASLAAETLQDHRASEIAKSLAASALSQRSRGKQTGSELEDIAAKVLASNKYSTETKELAASVLLQSTALRSPHMQHFLPYQPTRWSLD